MGSCCGRSARIPKPAPKAKFVGMPVETRVPKTVVASNGVIIRRKPVPKQLDFGDVS